MKINSGLFLFVLISMICITSLASYAGDKTAVTDPVADYAMQAGSEYDLDNPSDLDYLKSVRLVRFIDDFDSDGIKDMAMSDSSGGAWGNAGGLWKIYLGRKDGKYVPFKEEFFFRPGAISIQPVKNGVSKITIFSRINSETGNLSEFRMTSLDLKLIKNKVISPEDKSADKKEYEGLFGRLNKQPLPDFCMLKAYLKHNKCKWEKGY